MSNAKEINISDLVRDVFSNTKSQILQGEFHISEESIIRFLEFYTISKYINENEYSGGVSLRQIHKNKLVLNNKKYTYDKLQDFYTKLNQREKYRLKAENKLLDGMDTDNEYKMKSYRIKNTSKVKSCNLFQLDMLFNLHNSNYKEKETYNRIRRNNLHKINYKNFKDLVSYFDKQIEVSKLEYKNIQYYLIEQTMMKELITTMSHCYSKLKNSSTSINEMERIFLAVSKIPIIDERHIYIELFSEELSYRDKAVLEMELDSLYIFISYCICEIQNEIEYLKRYRININYDKVKFKEMYIDVYRSKYKLKKDFEVSDFKVIMNMIQSFNNDYIRDKEEIIIDSFKKERKTKLKMEDIINKRKMDEEEIDF
ncbi:TPA: hypothetical protein KQF34_003064 [Clostridioides difficile]|nr:hypothetical protein [Clostridioides difficile]